MTLNRTDTASFSLTLSLVSLLLLPNLFLSASSISITLNTGTDTSTNTASTVTSTPIKHIVIIYQENTSFDHYFATYPYATNPSGEPHFSPAPNTPSVNGLRSAGLLTDNPNLVNPFRLDRSMAITNDNDHSYTAEQKAFDGGLMDKFVQFTGAFTPNYICPSLKPGSCHPEVVMGYYDGNTVTALWNYAQHFSMSDNYFGTTFGPSIPGHINLISGQTHGVIPVNIPHIVSQTGTLVGNADPVYDDCSLSKEDTFIVFSGTKVQTTVPNSQQTIIMQGKNIGDLLNTKGVTWGWFSAGFKPNPDSTTKNCNSIQHSNGYTPLPVITHDYYPDVEPFQFYKSTSNPHHLPPTSIPMIGHTDQANHQYDISDFWNAAESGNLPAVSFLKAPSYQQGHPGYSGPLLEQTFLVNTINHLQKLPQWQSTAVIYTYDDSDGWYDHVMSPIISQSNDPQYDALFGANLCGHAHTDTYQDRCGYGPRLAMLVISPYSRVNYVDHKITDQTSITRFIEDNWNLGRIGDQSLDAKAGSLLNMFDFSTNNFFRGQHADNLFLDPSSGEIVQDQSIGNLFPNPFHPFPFPFQ